MGERSREHIQDARNLKQSSHFHMHLSRAHPDWVNKNWEDFFGFEVEEAHINAFNMQLAEALEMKNTKSVVMNLKDEYKEDQSVIKRRQGQKRRRNMVQHENKEYRRKEKMKAALENREKYHQKRKGRNSKRVKDSEHATGNANLVQNDNLSNQQIRDSRDNKLSHKPVTVNRDNCHQLGTLGIRNKYGFITHSRPVKPNGKIKGKKGGIMKLGQNVNGD